MEQVVSGAQPIDLSAATSSNNIEVPFRPGRNGFGRPPDSCPQYLFRVFSKRSAGENNNEWMRASSALGERAGVFTKNPAEVAIVLNEHLRGQSTSWRDPFISWTTSFLFALRCAVYKSYYEMLPMREIFLCMAATDQFATGTFLQDRFLITEFEQKLAANIGISTRYESQTREKGGLGDFGCLRSGIYYFGEYLAQGQLCIKDRSCTVSCDRIFHDLPTLRPGIMKDPKSWAKETVRLRNAFYEGKPKPIDELEVDAAQRIVANLPMPYRTPMVVYLVSLQPRRCSEVAKMILDKNPTEGNRTTPPALAMISAKYSQTWHCTDG